MSFDPLTAAFELGKVAIEKIWPDPAKRAEELLKLEKLKQDGQLAELNAHVQLMVGQISINAEEAKHPNWFIAGWRPGVGWVGVISLFFMYIPKAIVMTGFWCYQVYLTLSAEVGIIVPSLPMFPDLGTGDIIGLLLSILGVGAMRSYEKKIGVETKGVSNG
jgi:hypothetical protein